MKSTIERLSKSLFWTRFILEFFWFEFGQLFSANFSQKKFSMHDENCTRNNT